MTTPPLDLKAAFRSALGARISALAAAGAAMRAGSTDATDSIRRMAHSLRGSGGSFGFPEVTADAAVCEDAPADALLAALERLLSTLHQVVASGPEVEHVILFVEDDHALAALAQVVLAGPDRRIFAVQTVHGAREVLEDHEPSLIVLDLVLPDGDGRNLLVELRAQPRTARVPIIVLSGLTSNLVKAECLTVGANEYVVKPFDPEFLAARVTKLLERRSESAALVPVATTPGATLPPDPAPGAPEVARVVPPRPGPVLVAEDDDLIAAVVGHRLARDGLEMQRFGDGASALAAAKATSFALVILDVKMPAMDGFELLERLRALSEYATTPIIMLTSMGSERDIARGLELGASDYIVKPFSPVELMARVNRHLMR